MTIKDRLLTAWNNLKAIKWKLLCIILMGEVGMYISSTGSFVENTIAAVIYAILILMLFYIALLSETY